MCYVKVLNLLSNVERRAHFEPDQTPVTPYQNKSYTEKFKKLQ